MGVRVGEYTPHIVARILREGTEQLEDQIDIALGLDRLPEEERQLLSLYATGLSAKQALDQLHLEGNPQRRLVGALRALCALINGDSLTRKDS